ncbi:hypothetical protein Bpfe_017883 [Biomphalaria pfeifferi]|uniref:Uncharacterized protein n=1 Tax=Biomphalaria pfeifferi TaxID=112525 RepID=A0AAD8BDQ7_BIOPF|nr:hypothetical protein Bpfe_017883 [Biomphalaria pfeifferi]
MVRTISFGAIVHTRIKASRLGSRILGPNFSHSHQQGIYDVSTLTLGLDLVETASAHLSDTTHGTRVLTGSSALTVQKWSFLWSLNKRHTHNCNVQRYHHQPVFQQPIGIICATRSLATPPTFFRRICYQQPSHTCKQIIELFHIQPR